MSDTEVPPENSTPEQIPALSRPLTPVELDIVSFIEFYYHENNGLSPASTILKSKWPDVNDPLSNPRIIAALENRGITFSKRNNNTPLSNEQIAAVLAVTNIVDRRSLPRKLKDMGLSEARWNGWLKQKRFKEFLHKMAKETFDNNIHSIQEALQRTAEKGNVEAIKLYLEMTGRAPRNSAQFDNLNIVMTRIVESIQRHVKDPVIIQAIAKDFEVIMRGEEPVKALPHETPIQATLPRELSI